MEKEVLIQVTGFQSMETSEDSDPVELVVAGNYYFRNGGHYLRYEEMVDDSGVPTVNYIKFSDKGMEVRKKGLINVQMVFEKNKKNMAFYTTPFGTVQMGITTTLIDFVEEEDRLGMRVEYALEMNEEHVADCFLEIHAQSKDRAEAVL